MSSIYLSNTVFMMIILTIIFLRIRYYITWSLSKKYAMIFIGMVELYVLLDALFMKELLDNYERLFFGFFDAFVSYAAVTATFFPVSLILHHAHTIKQLIPAAFNFFSVFSAFLRSV